MSNISPSDMLKIEGKWKRADPFFSLIADRNKISIRQAKRLVKKSLNEKKITRIPVSNQLVLYGLEEFGSPFPKIGSRAFQRLVTVLEQMRDLEIDQAIRDYYENAPRQ